VASEKGSGGLEAKRPTDLREERPQEVPSGPGPVRPTWQLTAAAQTHKQLNPWGSGHHPRQLPSLLREPLSPMQVPPAAMGPRKTWGPRIPILLASALVPPSTASPDPRVLQGTLLPLLLSINPLPGGPAPRPSQTPVQQT
jgi:hypothetical protein